MQTTTEVQVKMVEELSAIRSDIRELTTLMRHTGETVNELKQEFKEVKSASIEASHRADNAKHLADLALKKFDTLQLEIKELRELIEHQDDQFHAVLRDYDMKNDRDFRDFKLELDKQSTQQVEQKRWLIGTIIAVVAIVVPVAISLFR